MVDGAFFSQNGASVRQVGDVPDDGEFRLDRLELTSQLRVPFRWDFELNANYNGLDQNNGERGWTISDLNVSVPLWSGGAVTVGEQAAGVGMERLTRGEDLPFMERSTMSEAIKKSHELGVRFTGTALNERLAWSAGWFNDWLTNGDSFEESGNLFAARVTGLLVDADGGRRLLHVGVSGAYEEAPNGTARVRSRPEVHQSPDFVDTGSFAADHTESLGLELAAQQGPVAISGEYTFTDVSGASSGSPRFAAYYVMASWTLTGEPRPYDRKKGVFERLRPSSPFSFRRGGSGAWEFAARYSWIDLDSNAVRGGRFDRFSAALSWYPAAAWRVQFNYGYGRLDRSGVTGLTRFYQLRLQFEL